MAIHLQAITPVQKLTIAKGLCDYQFIMEYWHTNSEDFRNVYYNFYLKARWAVMSKRGNRDPYFQKLTSITPSNDLIEIIIDLKETMECHSLELSLASKLLHTVNPLSPIYDKKIREYLAHEENVEFWWQRSKKMYGQSAPRGTSELDKIKHDWTALNHWYQSFLTSPRGHEWIAWFDTNFPDHTAISDVKKIDFIIFSTR